MRVILALALGLLVAGCGGAPRLPADAGLGSSSAYPDRPGLGRIEGQAVTRRGVAAAGAPVILMPVTAATTDFVARGVGGAGFGASVPPALERQMTFTTAYAGGRFMFGDLAAGRYHVLTRLPAADGTSRSAFVARQVAVAPGRTSSVILSD